MGGGDVVCGRGAGAGPGGGPRFGGYPRIVGWGHCVGCGAHDCGGGRGSGWGIGPGSRVVEALPPPRVSPFPAAFQDISLLVSACVPAQAVADAVREGAGELLEDIELPGVCTGSADRRGSHVADIRAAVPRAGSHADRSRRQCGPRCCGTSRSGGGRRCIARLEPRNQGGPVRFGQNLGGAVGARGVTVVQPLGIPPFEPRAELRCAQSQVNP
jgi:hypothetical protein